MSSTLAIALLTGLASLLAGLVVGRGLLKRRQGEKCRELAQDLTDKVHDRCDAYRRLEERISGVIGDFDQQETEPRVEPFVQTPARQVAAAAAHAVAPACAEGLGWMDACAGSCPPAAAQVDATRIVQSTTTSASSAKTVEGEIDVFAGRLRGAQDSNRVLLDAQSRAIEDLQRRFASMESGASPAPSPCTSAPEVFASAPRAARRVASADPELGGLSERLTRSERDLHEWRARCEEVVQEREAGIAKAREVLEQLRSDAQVGTSDCESCGRAQDLARQILDLRPDLHLAPAVERVAPRAQPRPVQTVAAAEEALPASRRETQPSVSIASITADAARLREVEELEQKLVSKQNEVEAMRSELSKASQVIDGNRTRITHLMRSLEQTQAKAEERRRLVQEQTTQVNEAYSMLDRMRPLLRAIEGAAADNQVSALTPEYLEARSRG